MTESNIDNLIGMILALGSLFIFYNFLIKGITDRKTPNVSTPNNNTSAGKSIWDKLKIISIVVSSLAALIFAIVKIIESFHSKS